jgi:hypothetical protein
VIVQRDVDVEDWRMSIIPVRLVSFVTLVAAASCSAKRPPAMDTTSATPAGTPAQVPAPAVQPAAPSAAPALDTTVSWRNISFHVVVRNDTLTIEPKGLAIDNRRIDESITGSPVKAEIGDLNKDNWPELLVYFVSQDSVRRGDLIGYSSNAGKSVSQLYFSGITYDTTANKGYGGHDEFAIVDGAFVQRFPVHDAQGKPTGKTRQIRYKLVDGEAARGLKIEKIVEF